ncbi:MAG: FkbM family methyltransferase [Bacteroidales bacterium]|nr:FkbM family methyltransferase [Bacteroidales bacterium]
MKQLLKQLLTLLHISVTRNQKYDAYTRKIIERSITPRSNCIDIGCHKGEILDLMIKGAGDGVKMGFEPIPELYDFLTEKYRNQPLVKIHDVALYDSAGVTTFQHVLNAQAYSGIKKRRYDGKQVEIEQIQVRTGMLDEIIPATLHIDLIKIDVEGAEFRVMLGGKTTLQRCKPVVIFEFGMGAAEFYDSTPEKLYLFLSGDCGMKISTLKGFLEKTQTLSKEQFVDCYRTGKEYYFVAHP